MSSLETDAWVYSLGTLGLPCAPSREMEASFPWGNQTNHRQDLSGQAVPELGAGCRALKCGAQLCDGFHVGGQAAAKKECGALNALLGRVVNCTWRVHRIIVWFGLEETLKIF